MKRLKANKEATWEDFIQEKFQGETNLKKVFLKNKYDNGQKLVTNTNPESKDSFYKVKFMTLYKNDASFRDRIDKEYAAFKAKVEKDFEAWKKNKSETSDFSKLSKNLEKDKAEVRALGGYKSIINNFKDASNKDSYIDGLYYDEDIIGMFEDYLTRDERGDFKDIGSDWLGSSSYASVGGLYNWLESLGIQGSNFSKNPDRKYAPFTNTTIRAFEKAYAFQQAIYEDLGIKELTLYRGVSFSSLNGVPHGTKVNIECRRASSFSFSKGHARDFGQVVEFKVPVERVLFSDIVLKTMEKEAVVMGASQLKGVLLN